MKRNWLLVLIALNLAALIALAFAYPHLMLSPGAVIPAHAEINTDCFACHAPLRGATAERCTSCHTPADIGVRTSKGVPIERKGAKVAFHQKLTQQNCIACHGDHQQLRLDGARGKRFSHQMLASDMAQRCESCHAPPVDQLHSKMAGSCAQCHRTEGWRPATFAHDKLFVLDRDHNAACVTCHERGEFKRYTCYGCHEHQPEKIRRKHVKEGIANFENCVQCHRSAHEREAHEGRADKRDGKR